MQCSFMVFAADHGASADEAMLILMESEAVMAVS